jgi:OOP family OmpA-OmpF porin
VRIKAAIQKNGETDMDRHLTSTLLLAAGLGILSGGPAAQAQAREPESNTSGYLVDQRKAVVRSGSMLCWRTGYWTPALAIVECDPDLVKKAEAPPLAVAPPPAAPPPARPAMQKLTLAADALFDFDKSTLRPEGRSRIDLLADEIKGINLEVIIVVGHADRIGSAQYNQKLSERRAESVKAQLVSKGIAANLVHTEGRGEQQPVTGERCLKMGKENGRNRKLVECLQADRRVVIEVIGTR